MLHAEILKEQPLNWEIRGWDVAKGLPDSYVSSVCKGPDGYIWVATYQGLSRFDGQRFYNFSSPDNYSNAPSMPTALWKDQEGTIWIGDAEGNITIYKNGRFEEVTLECSWSKQLIVYFESDQEGNVWFLDGIGDLVRLKDGYCHQVRAFGEDTPVNLTFAKDRESGALYALIRGFLWELSGEEPFLCKLEDPSIQGGIEYIGSGYRSGIWIFQRNLLCKWEQGSFSEVIHFESEFIGGIPTGLIELADGRIGVSSPDKGLLLINSFNPTVYQRISAEEDPWVICTELDENGALWVGYSFSGLGCLTEVGYRVLRSPDMWRNRPVKSVKVDSLGHIWVGTEGHGMYQYDGEEWHHYGVDSGLRNFYVWAIQDGEEDEAWVGTWGDGLYQYGSGYVRKVTNWPNGKHCIAALEWDAKGALWAGTSSGLVKYEDGQYEVFDNDDGIVSANVRVVESTPDGTLWFGMLGGGLGRISESGEVKQFLEIDGLSDRHIGALYWDMDGNLWIGTYRGGLIRYKDGFFSVVDTTNGLPSNNIASILEDHLGNFWFSSDKGVFAIQKKDLLACMDGDVRKVQLSNAGFGLDNLDCVVGTQHCADIGPNGDLYYATKDRVIVVSPDLAKMDTPKVSALIEELWVDGNKVMDGAVLRSAKEPMSVVIEPGISRFEFRFTVPTYVDPALIQCHYQLDGVDRDWTEAGRLRNVVYRNLSPGEYVFRVEAGTRSQEGQLIGESFKFEVLPFWWERLWVRTLGFLFLMMTAMGLVYWRIAWRADQQTRRLEREKALERERIRIARDLHDDLGSSLTHISQLSSQKSNILSASKQGLVALLERICVTSSESVQQMDEIVWAVNPRHDTLDSLANYLAQYTQTFLEAAGISCRLDIPIVLPRWSVGAEIRHNCFLAFKEALNNVVKHSRATEVMIKLSIGNMEVSLEIRDNGIGLNKAPILSDGRISSGNGLTGMQNRIVEMGGSFKLESPESKGVHIFLVIPFDLLGINDEELYR